MTRDSRNVPGLIAVDVGGGTQDIFVRLEGETIENCPKLVMPSPTRLVARKIATATAEKKSVFLFGETMGGGVCAGAARDHVAAGFLVYATPDAAKTFHDNPERVKKMGVIVTMEPPGDAVGIRTGDVDAEAIEASLRSFGVEPPSSWAVAVQDHGYSPGASNRETRFRWLSPRVIRGT